jgi:hypothetical protein
MDDPRKSAENRLATRQQAQLTHDQHEQNELLREEAKRRETERRANQSGRTDAPQKETETLQTPIGQINRGKKGISGPCIACDMIISFEAATCPHCGQPEAGKKSRTEEEKIQKKQEAVAKAEEQSAVIKNAILRSLKLQWKRTGELTEADLEKVWRLELSGTPITDAGLKGLTNLSQLTSLFLSKTEVTNAGLKEIANLQKLSHLGLWNTQITDAGLKEMAKLKELTYLDLRNTQITDTGLKEMAKMKQLGETYLSNTKATKAGVEELKKSLPKCSIHHNFQ